jgi:PAS domain S-box-containing protein
MGIGIIQDNKIKYINKTCADIFGYTIEEMMQWEIKDIINAMHPEDRNFLIPQVTKKQRGEKGYEISYQYRGIKKSGEIIWIENYSNSIQFRGKPADLITVKDITEQKIAEQRLRESEENYRKAYERENFYKDLFTHDMSNILQGMLISLEIYGLEFSSHNASYISKENLNIYEDQVKRAISLVNNVRKFSQLDQAQIMLKKIDFRKTIKEAYNLILNQVRDKKINLQLNFSSDIFFINADNFLLDVFENLLYNSVKHNKNQEIEILIKSSTIQKEKNRLLKLEIIDNGIGIPDERKERIFMRANKEAKSVSGIGLGLSLVKKILENYNAEIYVENRISDDYSKGSNFILVFSGI